MSKSIHEALKEVNKEIYSSSFSKRGFNSIEDLRLEVNNSTLNKLVVELLGEEGEGDINVVYNHLKSNVIDETTKKMHMWLAALVGTLALAGLYMAMTSS